MLRFFASLSFRAAGSFRPRGPLHALDVGGEGVAVFAYNLHPRPAVPIIAAAAVKAAAAAATAAPSVISVASAASAISVVPVVPVVTVAAGAGALLAAVVLIVRIPAAAGALLLAGVEIIMIAPPFSVGARAVAMTSCHLAIPPLICIPALQYIARTAGAPPLPRPPRRHKNIPAALIYSAPRFCYNIVVKKAAEIFLPPCNQMRKKEASPCPCTTPLK